MQKRQNLPIVCGTLVVINVIVYLICTFTGDLLYNIGELDAVAVLRYGEYGRILSSTFLHAGIEHLFNNMVILFFLGANDRKSNRAFTVFDSVFIIRDRRQYLFSDL